MLVSETPTRPVIRYFGGKFKIAPWVISHFPPHRVYVEPFGGAASVLLQKKRSYAEVYNDLFDDIVNLFRVLRNRDQAAELERQLRLTPYARTEFELSYQLSDDPVEQARRTIIRAQTSVGASSASRLARSGFRTKSFTRDNHPTRDWVNYPDILPAVVARLQGVVIENKPALQVIQSYDKAETLYYVDPPYVRSTRKDASKNYLHETTDQDHCDLAETLKSLQGMVILSGYDSPLYNDLYAGWKRDYVSTYADRALPKIDVLFINPAAAAAAIQKTMF